MKKEVAGFNDAYDIVKNIGDFPSTIFTKVGSLALLNADILNISGIIKMAPLKRLWQLKMVL